jgi:hypothetical protein
MAGSRIVAVRSALITGLAAVPALSAVDVIYAWKFDEVLPRERIFTNRARATHTPASLKSGRTFRNEQMTFDLVVRVEGVDLTAEETDTRALVLGTACEEYVADNRTLGGTVTGLNWIVVSGVELNNLSNDRGHLSELTYTLAYDARLT